MDHDNVITMCYINKTEHALEHPEDSDMLKFDNEAFKTSLLSQCKGKQKCNAYIPNSVTGISKPF